MTMQKRLWRAGFGGACVAALAAHPAAGQTNTIASASTAASNPLAGDTSAGQQDIIVTATKRAEPLMQIAAPISAVSGDQLARANANSLADYITRLPGVVFNDYQPGVSEVVIRGIAASTYHEQGQTTVGYYLNEVNIVEPNFPIVIPDVDTFDLDRVEVLRGPQGTLFGSSTLGGLVNYIAKTADVTKFDAAGEGLVSSTHGSDKVNYAGKVMVNIPIVKDTLAVRVMALQREDAGYLDNIGLTPPQKGSNNFRTRGLRGSIVWTPGPDTKITYLGTYQDTRLDDQTYVSAPDSLDRSTGIKEPQRTSFFLNSLRLDQGIDDFATLTVLGSVDEKTNFTRFTDPYGYVTGVFSGPNVAFDDTHAHANIKTIEARLASKGTGAFRWLIGSSYLRATKFSFDQIYAPGANAFITANPTQFAYPASVLAPGDRIYGYLSDTYNSDFGIFGEATLRVVKGVELTGGGRYYHTVARGTVTNFAGYVSGSPTDLSGSVNQKESGFTPKATLTLRPTSNVLGYFTYSQGYRVGGINPNAGLLPTIPNSYHSDKIDNYEAGFKATMVHGHIIVDLAAFNMVWKNIQAREFGPAPQFYSYVVNAASANSSGFEASLAVKPVRNLTLSSNITVEDARLTSFLPYAFTAGGGYIAGTRLPGSSKFSVSNNIDYDFPSITLKPTVSLAHRYLSKAPVAFGSTFDRGGYNLFDARVGISVYDHFRLLGFVDNIFNKYGVLNGPFASTNFPAYSITRPRTYGLRVDWSL